MDKTSHLQVAIAFMLMYSCRKKNSYSLNKFPSPRMIHTSTALIYFQG